MKKTKSDLIKEQNKKLLPFIVIILIIAISLQFFDSIEGSIIKMIFWAAVLIFGVKYYNDSKKKKKL
ncbi:MAG: hypothetical protein PHN56_04785 [Candidatus Nanoarchaeia archaeon]|nr:hypothetical protein [Candidatus Nanoarchaeia archaeon]